MNQDSLTICVFGAGAWGTAMALHLDRRGHRVCLIPRRESQVMTIRHRGENPDYLPGIPIPASIRVEALGTEALAGMDLGLMACPSFALRAWCTSLARILEHEELAGLKPFIISLSKGLEPESLKLPSDVLNETLPKLASGVLSGPNFAREVAEGKPTAGVLASPDTTGLLEYIQAHISGSMFRVYRSQDVIGVELGGCLKNIYAIGAGICDGLGLGDNAKAALITRSLHEMVRLVNRLGGQVESVYGLSGFGDLVATCFGRLSRNRDLGERLGKGETLRALLENRKTVVEGYWACQSFHDLGRRHGVVSPILEQLFFVLYDNKSPEKGLSDLMMRQLKEEGHITDLSIIRTDLVSGENKDGGGA